MMLINILSVYADSSRPDFAGRAARLFSLFPGLKLLCSGVEAGCGPAETPGGDIGSAPNAAGPPAAGTSG
jgi:hypothetical protein